MKTQFHVAVVILVALCVASITGCATSSHDASQSAGSVDLSGSGSSIKNQPGEVILPFKEMTQAEPFKMTSRRQGGKEEENVTLNFVSWETDWNNPSVFNQYMLFVGDGKAYVSYPKRLPQQDKSLPYIISRAKYRLSPTASPECGLAVGTVCYYYPKSNSQMKLPSDQQKNQQLIDLNFGDGAEVTFSDSTYDYPVAPGIVARGYGVRFGKPTPENPTGILPIGNTTIGKVSN